MVKNSLGRLIPETFGGRSLTPYAAPFSLRPEGNVAPRPLRRVNPGAGKLLSGLREATELPILWYPHGSYAEALAARADACVVSVEGLTLRVRKGA